jgi:hypothetical protein
VPTGASTSNDMHGTKRQNWSLTWAFTSTLNGTLNAPRSLIAPNGVVGRGHGGHLLGDADGQHGLVASGTLILTSVRCHPPTFTLSRPRPRWRFFSAGRSKRSGIGFRQELVATDRHRVGPGHPLDGCLEVRPEIVVGEEPKSLLDDPEGGPSLLRLAGSTRSMTLT